MSAPGDPAADPLIGQVVDGRYHIRRVIGRGGMGVVYEAEATRLGRRPCAVKVLLPEFTSSDTAVARFSREAELAGRIKHPNVVEIFDTGTTLDGRGYIAMEMLRGESLDRTMRREGPLPWGRAQHILIQICRALTVAHAEQIVHRDMKPENCFRSQRDDDPDFIKVLDFGIAKLTNAEGNEAQRLTATHAVIGTYAYMANEQVRGEEIDHRVDVWALGVMLYEMLTGRLPFRGNNPGQIWTAICNYDPEPMRSIAPQAAIPEPAEAIVRRALARDREQRYPTVEALAHAIASVNADGTMRAVTGKFSPVSSSSTSSSTSTPVAHAASPTFGSGPTEARTAAPRNSRIDPVNPHGHTELSAEEAVDTDDNPRPDTDHRTGLEPANTANTANGVNTANTAIMGPPIAAQPAIQAPQVPAVRGSRRLVWPLAGLGAAGVALIVWLSQGTGATTTSTPDRPPIVDVVDPADQAPTRPPMIVPGPTPAPTPAPTPEPTPEAVPDPPPTVAKPTVVKKAPERYSTRVRRVLNGLRGASKLTSCFGGSTAPLDVDVKIAAATGVATVTVPPLKRDSALDRCIRRAFQATTFPTGGPGDKDVEVKRYTLNKQ